MSIILLMIPMSLILGFGFLASFIVALNKDQFTDLDTPAHRILFDDHERNEQHENKDLL